MTPEKERVLELTRRHVAPHRVDVWDAFGTQLVIGRREGYRLWDLDGRELIDLHLNGGTFNLGHRHPDVVEAMVTAAATLDVGNHHFASLARAELAERLAELTPGELTYTVFASGGSEAIDIAIKTARRTTGRRRIVTLAAGYHGRTGLSGAAGEDGGAAYFLSDMPEDFAKVPFADPDAIEAELARGDAAAVLLETVPATYGFPVPPDGYLPAVKSALRGARCALHRRRGPDRARPHRATVGGGDVRRRAGHPRVREGPVRRYVSDRRDRDDSPCGGLAARERLGARVHLRRGRDRLPRRGTRARDHDAPRRNRTRPASDRL